VVADTLESFRPALARRGIAIEAHLDAGVPVLLDPDSLAQITDNLISNVGKDQLGENFPGVLGFR